LWYEGRTTRVIASYLKAVAISLTRGIMVQYSLITGLSTTALSFFISDENQMRFLGKDSKDVLMKCVANTSSLEIA
jgi:hypothetical protein